MTGATRSSGMDIVVVGAGIGGLCAAACLLRDGHRVRVVEQSARPGELGAGVQMSANAMKVLEHLGLRGALEPHAARPLAFEFRRWDSGAMLHRLPLGAAHEQRHGAPYFQLHRADLHGALERNNAFQFAVYQAARSPVLLRLIEVLRMQSVPHCTAAVRAMLEERPPYFSESWHNHAALVAATFEVGLHPDFDDALDAGRERAGAPLHAAAGRPLEHAPQRGNRADEVLAARVEAPLDQQVAAAIAEREVLGVEVTAARLGQAGPGRARHRAAQRVELGHLEARVVQADRGAAEVLLITQLHEHRDAVVLERGRHEAGVLVVVRQGR